MEPPDPASALHARWRNLGVALGARDQALDEVYRQLDHRYREAHRFYHTWEHIASCLHELDSAAHLCARPQVVELALWFHDVVYDPHATDNEERSATLLSEAVLRLAVEPEISVVAQGLVRATAHFAEEGWGAMDLQGAGEIDQDMRVTLDIDLATLGSPSVQYDRHEKEIRQEYAFLTEGEWREGRGKLIEAFLARPRIYRTDFFRARYETQARENLTRSLKRLVLA